MGVKQKIKVGRAAFAVFRVLRVARRLRGTPIDLFGRAQVRRVERELIAEYVDLVRRSLAALTPDTAGAIATVAGLPDLVRGYEEVKLRNVTEFRKRAETTLAALDASSASGTPQE